MEYLLVFDLPSAFDEHRRTAHGALAHELNIHSRIGTTPAHITVKSWFSSKLSADDVRTLVRSLPRDAALMPVSARIGQPAAFDENVLYLPMVGDSVKRAIEKILIAFDDAGIRRKALEGKTPHTTVVKDVPGHHVPLALGLLGSLPPPPTTVELSELVLYERETPDAPRREIERVYL